MANKMAALVGAEERMEPWSEGEGQPMIVRRAATTASTPSAGPRRQVSKYAFCGGLASVLASL